MTDSLQPHIKAPDEAVCIRASSGTQSNMCRTDQIVIRSNTGDICYYNPRKPLNQMTVLELKMDAVKTFSKSGPSLCDIRLIVGDKPMDVDSAPLTKYGIKSDGDLKVVQMVAKVHGG